MKIIYLHQYFNTPDMAGGTRSFEMARRMVKYGHSVEMITTYRNTTEHKTWFETEEEGVRVHWLPVPYSNRMGFLQRINAFLKFALKASGKASSLGGDVVFATSTPLTIAIPGIRTSKRLKVPMVFEVRDLWPELPIAIGAIRSKTMIFLARQLGKWAYRNSSRIVALSPGMMDGVIKAGYPRERISVIPNSCDIELFSSNGKGSDKESLVGMINDSQLQDWMQNKKLVVYTGTFGRINGTGYLVDICEKMKDLDPDVRFLMVGGGTDYEEIIERARKKGVLGKQLAVHEKIPKNELVSILQRATVASSLFINLEEMWANSANKFFDSLAAGKPVMINYEGWQANLLRESGAGIVVPPDDPRQAAQQLHDFLMDDEKLQNASSAAMKLAEDRFDRDKLANKLIGILENTVEEYEKGL